MANMCIIQEKPEYQTLKEKSGMSDSLLTIRVAKYYEQHGEMPQGDQIAGFNSSNHLRESLKLKENDSTSVDNIYKRTNTTTIEEASSRLNDEYRDQEVKITPIVDEAFVDVTERPRPDRIRENTPKYDPDQTVDSYQVFSNAVDKLSNQYGIPINQVTVEELRTPEWRQNVPMAEFSNAFIYNGQIYVNLDKPSVDAPIHEMMHILIGGLRFSEPRMYQEAVQSVEKLPNYQSLVNKKEYQGRTRNDVNEEIFVTEVAKHLAGIPSMIDDLDPEVSHQIVYNTKRVLDSILMGDDSVQLIPENKLMSMTFKELTKYVNSSIMTSGFKGTINLEGSEVHRRLNNAKSELLQRGELEEICE